MRQAAGNPAKSRADGFHRKFEQEHSPCRQQQDNDRTWNFVGYAAADNKNDDRRHRQERRIVVQGVVMRSESFQTLQEDARHRVDLQPKEIFHLRAGNQHCDAVGEAHHNRSRNELDRRPHASQAHRHQQHTRHDRAHEQSIDTMCRDNPSHHNHESSRWTADLRLRTTQQRNKESRDNRAVNAGLRRQSRGNRKRHRQGQGHQSDGHARNQVVQKFVGVVGPQAKHRLRKPTRL